MSLSMRSYIRSLLSSAITSAQEFRSAIGFTGTIQAGYVPVGQSNGSIIWQAQSGTVGGSGTPVWTTITADTTASNGSAYSCENTGPLTITLPSPGYQSEITVSRANVGAVFINPNGAKVNGYDVALLSVAAGAVVLIRYIDATSGWSFDQSQVGWVPSTGLTQLMIAHKGITHSGNAISAWADQSGQGHDFAQSSSSNKPTHLNTGMNGHPGVDFDGSNDYMETADSADWNYTNQLVSMCVRIDNASSSEGQILSHSDAGAPYSGWNIRYNGGNSYPRKIGCRQGTSDYSDTGRGVINEQIHIVEVVRIEGVCTQFYLDGLFNSEVGAATISDASTPLRVGCPSHTSSAAQFNGTLGGYALFNRCLTHNTREGIRQFWKFAFDLK